MRSKEVLSPEDRELIAKSHDANPGMVDYFLGAEVHPDHLEKVFDCRDQLSTGWTDVKTIITPSGLPKKEFVTRQDTVSAQALARAYWESCGDVDLLRTGLTHLILQS